MYYDDQGEYDIIDPNYYYAPQVYYYQRKSGARIVFLALFLLLVIVGGFILYDTYGSRVTMVLAALNEPGFTPPSIVVPESQEEIDQSMIEQRVEQIVDGLEDRVAPPPVTPPVAMPPVVLLSNLKSVGRLEVVRYNTELVVTVTQENEDFLGIFPLEATQLTYKAHGELSAGFDLNKMSEGSFIWQQVNGEYARDGNGSYILTVYMPQPEVLHEYVAVDKSSFMELDKPFLGHVTVELMNAAEDEALRRFHEKAACEEFDGVSYLEKMNQNAAQFMSSLLSQLFTPLTNATGIGVVFDIQTTAPPSAGCG